MGVPRIYTPEYYRCIRALEDRHWWHAGMRAIATALLASAPDTPARPRVLDAGCGTGAAMAWARSAADAARVTGVDISAHALQYCRERGERALSRSSVMALPFRDGSFDLVLCNDVLQHLPSDGGAPAALRELHRVLRPGGHLLLRTNSRLGLPDVVETDFRRFDIESLCGCLRDAGFAVTRASYANLLPSLFASMVGRVRQVRPSRRGRHDHADDGGAEHPGLGVREGVMNRRWLNRLLTGLLTCEARYLMGTNRRLPFGHTIVCLASRAR